MYYSPLYICGGRGLGKTHLLHAVRSRFRERLPGAKIVCTTGDAFISDFVSHARRQRDDTFRAALCDADLLLVDDVLTLARHRQAQNTFSHVFNKLYQADRQIVLTGDRLPSATPLLDVRLRSRFEWGLTVILQEPDPETRAAIRKYKESRSTL